MVVVFDVDVLHTLQITKRHNSPPKKYSYLNDSEAFIHMKISNNIERKARTKVSIETDLQL